MRGDETQLTDLDAQSLRRHLIRLRGRLEALDLVGGEYQLEEAAQVGVGELRLGHLLHGVGERGQPYALLAQPAERICDVVMRVQLPQPPQDTVPLLLGQYDL